MKEIIIYDSMINNINFIDSLLISRYLYPDMYSHSMSNLCKYFNIKNMASHRAMGDVNALELIWKEIKSKHTNRGFM